MVLRTLYDSQEMEALYDIRIKPTFAQQPTNLTSCDTRPLVSALAQQGLTNWPHAIHRFEQNYPTNHFRGLGSLQNGNPPTDRLVASPFYVLSR